MGASLARFFSIAFDRLSLFPVKRKPIRFSAQKSFTTTGEEKTDEGLFKQGRNPFHSMLDKIVEKLTELSKRDEDWETRLFPEWDKLTITNLNDIFILFASPSNGMMDINSFSKCMDSYGVSSSKEDRERKFKKIDENNDGFINYDEFLLLLYNYDENETSSIELRKKCKELGDEIRYVTSLNIGDQLYHGLF